jgi:hypothetical protein
MVEGHAEGWISIFLGHLFLHASMAVARSLLHHWQGKYFFSFTLSLFDQPLWISL